MESMADNTDIRDDAFTVSNTIAIESKPELLESSHIERVSSFVRKHRNSFSQTKQAWISTSSILPFKDRKSRNASFGSSNSAGPIATDEKQTSESPEKELLNSPEKLQNDDPSQFPAEIYGKLLYHGKLQQNQIISILGKEYVSFINTSDVYHTSVLKSYMDEFDFCEMDIDDAFRKVCQKIDILGETQVIDRILFQISQRYWNCNEKLRNVFLSVDITYGILFSLVLLNTDLNIANIGDKESRKMSKKDFLKNTMDLVGIMIENDQDLKELSKSDKKKEWKKNLQSLLKNYYASVRDKGFINTGRVITSPEIVTSPYSLYRNNSSWSVSSGMSSSSFFSVASSKSSRQYSSFKRLLNPLRSAKSVDVKLDEEINKNKVYEGLVIRKHMFEMFDQKAKNRRWFKCRLILEMDESGVNLIMLPYDKKGISPGALPPSGPSAYQFLASGGRETLNLLHAVAEPLSHMSYSVKRPHVVLLALGNGSTYLFQVPSLECKETWARQINYCAATRSKEPLRDVLSSTDYGWNKIEWAIKKSQMEGSKVDFDSIPPYTLSDQKVLHTWERPIHNFRHALVSNVGPDKQLHNFTHQVDILKKELELHQDYRKGIEIMYIDSPEKELAVSNWSKKKSYFDAEINKYATYIGVLCGKSAKANSYTGLSSSLQRLSESDG